MSVPRRSRRGFYWSPCISVIWSNESNGKPYQTINIFRLLGSVHTNCDIFFFIHHIYIFLQCGVYQHWFRRHSPSDLWNCQVVFNPNSRQFAPSEHLGDCHLHFAGLCRGTLFLAVLRVSHSTAVPGKMWFSKKSDTDDWTCFVVRQWCCCDHYSIKYWHQLRDALIFQSYGSLVVFKR